MQHHFHYILLGKDVINQPRFKGVDIGKEEIEGIAIYLGDIYK